MIIVTGASGMLGGHLIAALSEQNPQQSILGIYSKNIPTHQYPNVRYVSCDLKDYYQLEEIITPDAEVYHCAAIVAFDKKSHATLIDDNVKMTENIVNASLFHKIQKLVHVSSIAAISREKTAANPIELISETGTWTNSQSNSTYANSKYFSELEVWRGIEEGLNAVIINPGIILGESHNWETGSSAIIDKIAKGLKFHTPGTNGYVDVKDVVDIMILLMNNDIKNERFIVVESNYSYKDLFDKIAYGLNVAPPHIAAKKWMSKAVVYWELCKSIFSSKPPLITAETARTAFQKNNYDNSKLKRFLPQFSYRDFDESILRITNSYKNAKK